MRGLLEITSPSTWALVSGVVFFVSFIAYAVVLFWPSRRAHYESAGQLPLEEEDNG